MQECLYHVGVVVADSHAQRPLCRRDSFWLLQALQQPPDVVSAAGLRRIPQAELERLIYPVGFFRDKARHLKALPDVLEARFGGVLPDTVEGLCELPGVGRKTANLVVALGFDTPAICVDVHVHRITNRLGLVRTKTPYDTEMALRELLPVRYWKTWNSYLVSFGQTRCAPRSPRCAGCPIAAYCPSRQV
jgi:endonuclease III